MASAERREELADPGAVRSGAYEVARGMAHDFNNYVQVVLSSLKLMRKHSTQTRGAEFDVSAETAQAALARAGHLVEDLLNLVGRHKLDRYPVDVNNTIASMHGILKSIGGSNVEVVLKLAPGPLLATCDDHQLERAILNLVVNARDALRGAGRIVIETSLSECGEGIRREARRAIRICVEDTGSGMSGAVVARAFEPFFTTKPLRMGTGLGLSIVREFAERSGGHVELRSAEGLGTAVRLYLPPSEEG